MIRYILRRCLQAIPVLLGITLFTFLMVHLTPGDPVTIFSPGWHAWTDAELPTE